MWPSERDCIDTIEARDGVLKWPSDRDCIDTVEHIDGETRRDFEVVTATSPVASGTEEDPGGSTAPRVDEGALKSTGGSLVGVGAAVVCRALLSDAVVSTLTLTLFSDRAPSVLMFAGDSCGYGCGCGMSHSCSSRATFSVVFRLEELEEVRAQLANDNGLENLEETHMVGLLGLKAIAEFVGCRVRALFSQRHQAKS